MAVVVERRQAPSVDALAIEPIVEARLVDKVYDTGKVEVRALRNLASPCDAARLSRSWARAARARRPC